MSEELKVMTDITNDEDLGEAFNEELSDGKGEDDDE